MDAHRPFRSLRHPGILLSLILALPGCQNDSPPEGAGRSGSVNTGEQWSIEEPKVEKPAPIDGSKSLKAGVAWVTDGPIRENCRFWIDLEWNGEADAYISKGRLPLSPQRPKKLEILLDARPWTVGNQVALKIEPLNAGAGASGVALSAGSIFAQAARDYVKGPQVGAVLEHGKSDLLGASRPEQDLRLTVIDPERKKILFVAIVKLSETENAPACGDE